MRPDRFLPAALLAISVSGSPGQAGEALFDSAFLTYGVPQNPSAIASGDWNEDGLRDLAVPNYSYNAYPPAGFVSILWGRPGGGFEGRSDLPLDARPTLFASADMDGDANEDFVIVDDYVPRALILYGDGAGSFPRRSELPLPHAPASFAVDRLDTDQYPDLVFGLIRTSATPGGNGGIAVFRNQGNGAFEALPEWESGRLPRVALLDLDADQSLDLAIANEYDNTVTVCLGHGDGTFGARREFPTGPGPVTLVGTDFNGDGTLDIATSNTYAGTISVLLGNGGGALEANVDWATGVVPLGLSAADLDGDGRSDLVSGGEGDQLSILTGKGDGTFAPARLALAGPYSYRLVIGDFTGDGIADVAATAARARSVALLPGNGDGSFGGLASYPVGAPAADASVSDLNRDGALDLAAAAFDGFVPGSGANFVSVRLGLGDGAFGPSRRLETGSNPFQIAVGDLNGDRWPDIATANWSQYYDPVGTLSVLLGTGLGEFSAHQESETSLGNLAIAIGDVTGDAKPDLVAGRGDISGACFAVASSPLAAPARGRSGSGANLLSVHPGDGSGSFPNGTEGGEGRAFDGVAVGDINDDGLSDIVVASWEPRPGHGAVLAYLGGENHTLGPPTTITAGVNPTGIALADLDQDGNLDILCANASLCEFEGSVSVMLGMGGGQFAPKVDYETASNSYSVAVGDLDGDAIADIAAAASGANVISVLLGKGDGTFGSRTDYGCGAAPWSVGIGDFDRDGRNDLVCANYRSHDLGVLRNKRGRQFYHEARAFPSNPHRSIALSATTTKVGIRVEPAGAGFSAHDVDPAAIWLAVPDYPLQWIRAFPTSETVEDSDGNGVPEVEASFSVGDLSRVLPGVSGRETVVASVEGMLPTGALFRASANLTVVGAENRLRVLVSPNPFTSNATLHFRTSHAGPVSVKLFDVRGRLLSTELDAAHADPSQYAIPLAGFGKTRMPSGIYFYRIEADGTVAKGRFAVVK